MEVDYTVSGSAQNFVTGAQSTFTLSFGVDGSAAINPGLYQLFNTPLDNFQLNVGGQLYTASSGEFWGDFSEGTAYSAGLVANGFVWEWQTFAPLNAHTLGDALLADSYLGNTGGLDHQWVFNQFTVAVTNPVGVPEPGMFALMVFALLSLALFKIAVGRHVNRIAREAIGSVVSL